MAIYGIKVLYRHEAGEDVFYEESVLRVEAQSVDEAFLKAEEYAREMCKMEMTNPFGERIITSIVQPMECFITDEEEDDDVSEVYSQYTEKPAALTDSEFEKMQFGSSDVLRLLAMRLQEYNEPWTRREAQILRLIADRQPITAEQIGQLMGGDAEKEIESLLQKKLIEQADDAYRTTQDYEEAFVRD